MSYQLTLLASSENLSIGHLELAEAFIADHAIGLAGRPRWIEPHIAASLPLDNAVDMQQMLQLRQVFAAAKIDIFCTKFALKAPRLLLADMDSTIVTTETLDELAAKAGIKDRIAAITARAMNGELDFHAALRERVGLLKDLPVTALHETLDETELCQGAGELVHFLREQGATCVLVSGGFTFFTSAIADKAGFHHHHGNELDHDGTVLVGTVGPDILDKDAKLAFLRKYAGELGIDLSETMAIGDGANDLPMLAAAGLGIGYRPKPILEESLLNVLKFAPLDRLRYLFT